MQKLVVTGQLMSVFVSKQYLKWLGSEFVSFFSEEAFLGVWISSWDYAFSSLNLKNKKKKLNKKNPQKSPTLNFF